MLMKKPNLDFININLLKPLSIKLIIKDIANSTNPVYSNEFHIKKAINWLILAYEKTTNGGFSHSYSLISGWKHSYPETSGYIIPTFLNYYQETSIEKLITIVESTVNWLCSIQLKNGGFQQETVDLKTIPSIFNSGQIIFGLLESYKKLNNEKYLESAIKAGNFLVKNQEKNGNWIKYCYQNKSHTYNVRTAWALLELFSFTDQKKFKEAAIKNLNWAKRKITDNFWFKGNTFSINQNPLLHFIAYTIRGFLESGIILNDDELIQIAFKSSLKLLEFYEFHGFLPATYDPNWQSKDFYSCLTGDAQLSIIWLKLFEIFKDKKFLLNGKRLNWYIKSKQVISNMFQDVDGAIKGSDPIWGYYMKYIFPNWAAKFFCDALLLENRIDKRKIG